MRVLVVDDEPIARARIVRLLRRLEDVEVVGEAENGQEALRLAAELAPDVMLLDVEMPGLDGLAVAETPGVPPVVFTTAHREHAVHAFDADAVDYLLKPIQEERLARALERVRERASRVPAEPWRLIVTDGSLKRFVDARQVDCFTSDQKYVVFRLDGEELITRESLDALEARLAPLGFLRASRGALVRRDAIRAWDAAGGGTLVLDGGERVPVSRRAAPVIRAALGI